MKRATILIVLSALSGTPLIAQEFPAPTDEGRTALEALIEHAVEAGGLVRAIEPQDKTSKLSLGDPMKLRQAVEDSRAELVPALREALIARCAEPDSSLVPLLQEVGEVGEDDRAGAFASYFEGLRAQSQRRTTEALERFDESSARFERLGDRVWQAHSLHQAGIVLFAAGDHAKCLDRSQRSLKLRRAALGENHRDVARSLNNLGYCYLSLHDYPKAVEHFRAAAAAWEALPDKPDPNLAKPYSGLGQIDLIQDRPEQAVKNYQRALEVRRAALGRTHAEVALSLTDIGTTYSRLRDYAKAREAHAEAVAIRRAALGPRDLSLAWSLYNLGRCEFDLGEHKRALEAHREALSIRRAALGDKHADVAESLTHVGLCHGWLKDDKRALEFYQQALAIRRALPGDQRSGIGWLLNIIGLAQRKLGKLAEAVEAHREAVAIRREASGKQHVDVAQSLEALGDDYHNLADYDHAAEAHREALTIRRALFGNQDASVAQSLSDLGRALSARGDYAQALECQREALTIRRATLGEKHRDVGYSLNSIACVYNEMGEYAKAEKAHRETLEFRRSNLGEKDVSVAQSYYNLGNNQLRLGYRTQARHSFECALAIYREARGETHQDVADTLDKIGSYYQNEGDYSKALDSHLQSLAISRKLWGDTNEQVAYIWHEIGYDYSAMKRFSEALDPYQKAVDIRKEVFGADHPKFAVSQSGLGFVQLRLGRYDAARANLENACRIQRTYRERNPIGLADAMGNLCALLTELGDSERAIELATENLAIRQKALGTRNIGMSTALYSLGCLYCGQDEYGKAEEMLQKCLALQRSLLGENHTEVAATHAGLAWVYLEQKDYKRAIDSMFESRRILLKSPRRDEFLFAITTYQLAVLNSRLNQQKEAIRYFDEAEGDLHRLFGQDHLYIAMGLDRKGDAYWKMNDLPNAMASYEKAVAVCRRLFGGPHRFTASALRDLGELYGDGGRVADAIRCTDEALQALCREAKPLDANLTGLAPEDLRPILLSSTVLMNRGYWLLRSFGPEPTLEQLRQCDRNYAIGTVVLERVRQMVLTSEERKLEAVTGRHAMTADWLGIKRRLFERDGDLEHLRGAYAVAEQGTARVLLEQMSKARAYEIGRVDDESRHREADIRMALRELATRISLEDEKPPGQYSAAAVKALIGQQLQRERELRDLIADLERTHPAYAAMRYPKARSLDEVRTCLADDEVALIYVLSSGDEPSYVVLVEKRPAPADPAGGLAVIELPGGNQIAEVVSAVLDPDVLALPARARAVGAEAFEVIFGGLHDRIRGKNLVIVPGGSLCHLPFELLVQKGEPGEEDRFLVEVHRIRYAPSLSVLYLIRQWEETRAKPETVLWALGDPVYEADDERLTGRPAPPLTTASRDAVRELGHRERGEPDRLHFPRLAFSGEEVLAIGRLLGAEPGNIGLGLDATEARVKRASADGTLARARYVHFATHGILGLDRGQQPALVLCPFERSGEASSPKTEDGLLRLDEVSQLQLNADLVVLSACRSGRGQLHNGEGVRGLSRAFLYAGTRAVLCSLWQVSDRETASLMACLYAGLKAGHRSPDALREAQVQLIADGQPPLYWAPFILVGE